MKKYLSKILIFAFAFFISLSSIIVEAATNPYLDDLYFPLDIYTSMSRFQANEDIETWEIVEKTGENTYTSFIIQSIYPVVFCKNEENKMCYVSGPDYPDNYYAMYGARSVIYENGVFRECGGSEGYSIMKYPSTFRLTMGVEFNYNDNIIYMTPNVKIFDSIAHARAYLTDGSKEGWLNPSHEFYVNYEFSHVPNGVEDADSSVAIKYEGETKKWYAFLISNSIKDKNGKSSKNLLLTEGTKNGDALSWKTLTSMSQTKYDVTGIDPINNGYISNNGSQYYLFDNFITKDNGKYISSIDTNVPIFDDVNKMISYLHTGDDSGKIDLDEYLARTEDEIENQPSVDNDSFNPATILNGNNYISGLTNEQWDKVFDLFLTTYNLDKNKYKYHYATRSSGNNSFYVSDHPLYMQKYWDGSSWRYMQYFEPGVTKIAYKYGNTYNAPADWPYTATCAYMSISANFYTNADIYYLIRLNDDTCIKTKTLMFKGAGFVDSTTISDDNLVDIDFTLDIESSWKATIPKKITITKEDKTIDYEISLWGNVGVLDSLSIIPPSTIEFSAEKTTEKITASVSQTTQLLYGDNISLVESNPTKIIGTITIDEDISAGDWEANLDFIIKFNKYLPGLYDASDNLLCTWEDSGIDVERDLTNTDGDPYLYTRYGQSANVVLKNIYANTTKIILPYGITKIGDNAFITCSALKEVFIPNTVTSIGTGAFYQCTNLNCTIPNSVNSVGQNAFSDCSHVYADASKVNVYNTTSSNSWYNNTALN